MTVFATHPYDNMTTKHRIIQVGSLAGSPSANITAYRPLTTSIVLRLLACALPPFAVTSPITKTVHLRVCDC